MRTNLAIRLSCALLAFLFLGIFILPADQAMGSCRIQNISLKKEGDFTKVTVYADKPFEFSHFTEEAKGGKPYRVIIDCQDAIFGLPQNVFGAGLPEGTLKAIRTSQYQAMPQRIVRVVLDMKAPVVYKVIEPETDYEASIAVFTANDPDFDLWVAVLGDEKGKKVSKEKPEPELSRIEKTPARVKAPKSGRTQAFHPSLEKPIDQARAAKQSPENTEKSKSRRRAVSYADTDEAVGKTIIFRPVDQGEMMGPQPLEESPVVVAPQKKAKKTEVTPPPELIETQTGLQRTTAGTRLAQSPDFWGPLPKKESDTKEKVTVAQTEGEKTSRHLPSVIEKGIGKILGPEPAAARETMQAPDTTMLIQGRMQAELSVVPQRRVVEYNPVTDRDVFLPPTEKEQMNFGEAPLPLFENLKLVGILKDTQGNRALLEDETGYGYILTRGERIRNGYVIAVEDELATFHVEEYGGYQIMVLELNPEY
jgi:hypothetical protein